MLGIAAMAMTVIAISTVVQYRETATSLTVVRAHEGRRFATTLAVGLLGMRERDALVGGTISLDSAPGRGTAIHVVLPLAANATHDPEAERRSA